MYQRVFKMIKSIRIIMLTTILTSVLIPSFADRGAGRKKKKVVLNIKTPLTFAKSLNFNLNNGMRFTGSLFLPIINTKPTFSANSFSFNTLITYQKGNCVYIVPYKQKVLVADVKEGYTGTKLIIKMK